MKKFLAVLLLSSTGFAALPPYHGRIAQIKAVLDSAEVQKEIESAASKMGISGLINSITKSTVRVGWPVYVVTIGGNCSLTVDLKENIPSHPGPTTYEAKVASPVSCK